MTLEHLGIAVQDAAAVQALYETLLGLTPYKTETVEREGVRTHFLDAGAKLELLEALGPDSPVARHIEKRGEGLHHVAFRVPDVDAAFARVQALGLTPLGDAPKPGADGKRIFFLHPRDTHGVLIELCGDDDRLPEPHAVPWGDGSLAAYTFGSPHRPPLLLLHGAAGATQLETLLLARELERAFYVVAFDFEGHGRSCEAAAPLTLDRLAESAVAVLDFFGLSAAHAVGYSLGGAVALWLAHRYPDRIRRVAAHATNVDWDESLVRQMTARIDADVLQNRFPEVWARMEAAHLGRTRRVFEQAAALTRTLPALQPRLAHLSELRAPVLVSAHDRDDLFPLAKTLALYHQLPHARLAIVPGNRHALRPESVPLLASVIGRFLGAP